MKNLLVFALIALLGVPFAHAQNTLAGDLTVQKTVKLTGAITPTTLSANVNDYAPTNFSAATVLRLAGNGSRSITGLAGGAAGRTIYITNVGEYPLTFVVESTASTAANRFSLGATDFALEKGNTLGLWYDSTSSRWRATGNLSSGGGSSSSGGGTGTVTSVVVVANNGVTSSVVNPSTEPVITLGLGAVTPTSVAATGAVSGSNLSGTNTGDETASTIKTKLGITTLSGSNTGDQTSVSGNAGSATVLQTARNINGVSFDGSSNITVPASAATLTGTTLASNVVGSSLTSAAGGSFGTAAFTNSTAYDPAGAAAAVTLSGLGGVPTTRTVNGHALSANVTVTAADVGAAPSSTVSFPGFGTTSTTAAVGNDARLSDARPANDVYAWAKAGTKPSYTASEVGLGSVENTALSTWIGSANLATVGTLTSSLRVSQISAPTACVASVNPSAGLLTGDYWYRVTYVTPNGETEAGAQSAINPVSPVLQKVNLTNIPISADSSVVARNIYRNVAGDLGNVAMKLVGAINDNSTTTYTDNVPDGSLGIQQPWTNTTGPGVYFGANSVARADTSSTAFGFGALLSTRAINCTAFGSGALASNTTGYFNTAIGWGTMNKNTTGRYSVAVGEGALHDNTTGVNNTAVGVSALSCNTTANYSTAVGLDALEYSVTGAENTAVGKRASWQSIDASYNTVIGTDAMFSNLHGSGNVAVGHSAFYSGSGGNNTAVGYSALPSSTGDGNTAVGQASLLNLVTGNNNVSIGGNAGRYQADGSTPLTGAIDSVYIGQGSRGLNNSDSNSIVVGTGAIGIGANTTVIGNASTLSTRLWGNVGIGITPTTPLEIQTAGTTVIRLNTSDTASTGRTLFQMKHGATNGWDFGVNVTQDGQDNFTIRELPSINRVFTLGKTTGFAGFGILAQSPAAQVEIVAGGAATLAESIRFGRGDANRFSSIYTYSDDGGNAYIRFNVHDGVTATSQASVLTLKGNGGVSFGKYGAGTLVTDSSGNITASSDARLKNVTGNFTRGLADVIKLTPRVYTWKPASGMNPDDVNVGFIAQEVQPFIPEAVGSVKTSDVEQTDSKTGKKSKIAKREASEFLSLSDRPIIAALVNAVKELKQENDELKERIAKLEKSK